jgi:hypothetical protein
MTACGADEDNGLCYSIDYTLGATSNIPFVYCQDTDERPPGCQMEIHYWAGSAGYCQSLPVIYEGQPYLVKLTYDYSLSEMPGQDIEIYGRVRGADDQDVILPSQSFSPVGETVWAIRTNEPNPDLHVCVGIRSPWASFGPDSKFWFQEFAIYALPLDYEGAVIDY